MCFLHNLFLCFPDGCSIFGKVGCPVTGLYRPRPPTSQVWTLWTLNPDTRHQSPDSLSTARTQLPVPYVVPMFFLLSNNFSIFLSISWLFSNLWFFDRAQWKFSFLNIMLIFLISPLISNSLITTLAPSHPQLPRTITCRLLSMRWLQGKLVLTCTNPAQADCFLPQNCRAFGLAWSCDRMSTVHLESLLKRKYYPRWILTSALPQEWISAQKTVASEAWIFFAKYMVLRHSAWVCKRTIRSNTRNSLESKSLVAWF